MSNETRDELERSFDCCGLFNLTTLYQQDYAFCTAVSWQGRGGWVGTLGKDNAHIGSFEFVCDCLSSSYLVLGLCAAVLGGGMDIEARELAKWDFNL